MFKKYLIIWLLFGLFSGQIFASDLTLGFLGGINIGWGSGDDYDDMIDYYEYLFGKASSESRMGFSLGLFLDIPVSESFSIQPELQYAVAKNGASVTDYNDYIAEGLKVETTETVNILYIPVLAKYKIPVGKGKINLFGGPMVFVILGDVKYKEEYDYNGETDSYTDENETDNNLGIGFSIGVGYEVPMGNGKLVTDLRFSKTLTEIMDDYDGKLNIFGINLGYGFNL